MVKITLITNAGRKTIIEDESLTLRQIYEKNDIDYGQCTNTVDSVPLKHGDMDKKLSELVTGETCRMSSIVKMDNAAEILIAGSACVVKSGVALEDWKKVLKYDPGFALLDKDDEPIFKVNIAASAGKININGATFSDTACSDGKASLTVIIDPEEEDKVKAASEKIGNALLLLNQLEKLVPAKVKEADEKSAEILAAIKLM